MWSLLKAYVDGGDACALGEALDVPAAKRAWTTFLAAHGAELEAGARFSLRTADPAILPASCHFPW